MDIVDRFLRWMDRRAERRSLAGEHHIADAGELGAIAARMTVDYRVGVAQGADRRVLAQVLTGIGGCDLAASRCYAAAGWDPFPRVGEPSHAESTRLAGLLCQEVAYAAAEGTGYRGVRAVEYQTGPIAAALREVALAYAGWAPKPHGSLGASGEPVSVEQRLDELLHVVLEVTRGQAVETLAALTAAHRRGRAPAATLLDPGTRTGIVSGGAR